jgi:hypothetical protein
MPARAPPCVGASKISFQRLVPAVKGGVPGSGSSPGLAVVVTSASSATLPSVLMICALVNVFCEALSAAAAASATVLASAVSTRVNSAITWESSQRTHRPTIHCHQLNHDDGGSSAGIQPSAFLPSGGSTLFVSSVAQSGYSVGAGMIRSLSSWSPRRRPRCLASPLAQQLRQ